MTYGLSLLALDVLYLFSQTVVSLIGWLLTNYVDLAFISLANFMFNGVLFLMFGSVLYGYYTPDMAVGSVYRLILVRVLLVWFWFLLNLISVITGVIGIGWAPRGGWGGRGDSNINSKLKK